MNLFLMRHCEPEPGEPMDATRQLTEQGKAQAKEMGEFLKREVGRVDITITSPFARAVETAKIVAPILGCPTVADTRMLQPDGEPAAMWAEITRLAQQSGDVLVVGHQPSISSLLIWLIADVVGDNPSGYEIKFKHGAIAHVVTNEGGKAPALHWFVTPKLIAKDEDEKQLVEAALALAENLNTKSRKAIADSLRKKLTDATAQRFQAQKKHVLKALGPAKAMLTEADKPGQTLPPSVTHSVGAALAGFNFPKFNKAFNATTGAAYDAASEEAAGWLGVENESELERTAADLAGELDKTTEERIATALRDVFEGGKGFSGLQSAIEGVFDDSVKSRAPMTGETEISAAWNKGLADTAQAASDAGSEIEKRWDTEDDPCPICEANEAQGWIDNEDSFDSGDDQPPAHPNCQCSLEMRAVKP